MITFEDPKEEFDDLDPDELERVVEEAARELSELLDAPLTHLAAGEHGGQECICLKCDCRNSKQCTHPNSGCSCWGKCCSNPNRLRENIEERMLKQVST